MNEWIELHSFSELVLYYKSLFGNILSPKDSVLYVGYEDEDILLPIIAECGSRILAIDREERRKSAFQNVQTRKMDFKDADKLLNDYFDLAILSFVLHENDVILHQEFIKKARKMAKAIIIIEPLARNNYEGKEYEEMMELTYKKRGSYKRFFGEEYWKQISGFNVLSDDCVFLDRSIFKKRKISKKNGLSIEVSFQNIIILICKNGREIYGAYHCGKGCHKDI